MSLSNSLAIVFILQQELETENLETCLNVKAVLWQAEQKDLHRDVDKMPCRSRENIEPWFYCEGGWAVEQNRLYRKVVESPSLDRFKT